VRVLSTETREAVPLIELHPGETNPLEMRLERQVDLRQRGWFAGDSHVHMIHGEKTVPVDFDQVALAARAEDLQYLSLGHAWALDDPTPERLEAELVLRSTPDCLLTWTWKRQRTISKATPADAWDLTSSRGTLLSRSGPRSGSG
jgi:hypothetical protein